MKYDIVFSIPIHERFEVVVDQILNFFHYNPNCAIVFHVSQGFNYKGSALTKDEFTSIINEIGNVYINPETVRTGRDDIIQAHLSNFKYISSKADFMFFSLCASNELFIKEGLYNHIREYDCGVELLDIEKKENENWFSGIRALGDYELRQYLCNNGLYKFYGSHVEGSYYKKELFNSIVKGIESFYDYKKMRYAYPREEVYFTSVMKVIDSHKKQNVNLNKLFSWSRWEEMKALKVWAWDVNRLIYDSDVFSVKRVDRFLNANLRIYIRQMSGLVRDEAKYLDNVKEKNKYLIYLSDINDYCLETIKSWARKIVDIKDHLTGFYDHVIE
jgi:hypothetical protein